MQLGMKSIPRRFVPLLMDKGLHQAFSDAGTSLSKAPSPWEVVEAEQKGGGFQPLDVPFFEYSLRRAWLTWGTKEVRACFAKTLDECNNVFATIKNRTPSNLGTTTNIEL